MIHGVEIHPLRQIPDERGYIMHMLRKDDPWFREFGEIYFSIVYAGVIKGWHLHKEMWLNYSCISGMIKLVLYDYREESPTYKEINEFFIGDQNRMLVTVPPLVWNAFQGISYAENIVANCATVPHRKDEMGSLDILMNDIPYRWK